MMTTNTWGPGSPGLQRRPGLVGFRVGGHLTRPVHDSLLSAALLLLATPNSVSSGALQITPSYAPGRQVACQAAPRSRQSLVSDQPVKDVTPARAKKGSMGQVVERILSAELVEEPKPDKAPKPGSQARPDRKGRKSQPQGPQGPTSNSSGAEEMEALANLLDSSRVDESELEATCLKLHPELPDVIIPATASHTDVEQSTIDMAHALYDLWSTVQVPKMADEVWGAAQASKLDYSIKNPIQLPGTGGAAVYVAGCAHDELSNFSYVASLYNAVQPDVVALEMPEDCNAAAYFGLMRRMGPALLDKLCAMPLTSFTAALQHTDLRDRMAYVRAYIDLGGMLNSAIVRPCFTNHDLLMMVMHNSTYDWSDSMAAFNVASMGGLDIHAIDVPRAKHRLLQGVEEGSDEWSVSPETVIAGQAFQAAVEAAFKERGDSLAHLEHTQWFHLTGASSPLEAAKAIANTAARWFTNRAVTQNEHLANMQARKERVAALPDVEKVQQHVLVRYRDEHMLHRLIDIANGAPPKPGHWRFGAGTPERPRRILLVCGAAHEPGMRQVAAEMAATGRVAQTAVGAVSKAHAAWIRGTAERLMGSCIPLHAAAMLPGIVTPFEQPTGKRSTKSPANAPAAAGPDKPRRQRAAASGKQPDKQATPAAPAAVAAAPASAPSAAPQQQQQQQSRRRVLPRLVYGQLDEIIMRSAVQTAGQDSGNEEAAAGVPAAMSGVPLSATAGATGGQQGSTAGTAGRSNRRARSTSPAPASGRTAAARANAKQQQALPPLVPPAGLLAEAVALGAPHGWGEEDMLRWWRDNARKRYSAAGNK